MHSANAAAPRAAQIFIARPSQSAARRGVLSRSKAMTQATGAASIT